MRSHNEGSYDANERFKFSLYCAFGANKKKSAREKAEKRRSRFSDGEQVEQEHNNEKESKRKALIMALFRNDFRAQNGDRGHKTPIRGHYRKSPDRKNILL